MMNNCTPHSRYFRRGERMQTKGKNFTGFSGNQLKVFVILAMALDHLAWTLWPGYDNKACWRFRPIGPAFRSYAPCIFTTTGEI